MTAPDYVRQNLSSIITSMNIEHHPEHLQRLEALLRATKPRAVANYIVFDVVMSTRVHYSELSLVGVCFRINFLSITLN